jgi:DNA-binding transcriptional ArsR family regulator
VNELAEPFDMPQPAISQHLKVLEVKSYFRQIFGFVPEGEDRVREFGFCGSGRRALSDSR